MDIIIEDLNGSLWAAAVENRALHALEVDPIEEIVRYGSVYVGKVTRIDAKRNVAYLDLGHEQTGIIYPKDVISAKSGRAKPSDKIGKLLQSGQLIAVQIKEASNPSADIADDLPISEKASRVSMDIALTGRHLIYTPLDPKNRVSKRVKDKKTRQSMQNMLSDIESIEGCIMRSSAADCQTDVLIREGKILNALWASLKEYLDQETEASLIMMGPDGTQRILSDCATSKIQRIAVSTMEQFQDVEDWCELYAPDLVTKIDPARDDETVVNLGLFESYGIIEHIETLLQPYVILKSGGNIIIQSTAALTAIDVNQALDGSKLNTNIEAAKKIAEQIRLRNIGGIIIIDFINVKGKKARDQVIEAFEKEAEKDACTIDVHGWTKTGLLEITRMRRTAELKERISLSGLDL